MRRRQEVPERAQKRRRRSEQQTDERKGVRPNRIGKYHAEGAQRQEHHGNQQGHNIQEIRSIQLSVWSKAPAMSEIP